MNPMNSTNSMNAFKVERREHEKKNLEKISGNCPGEGIRKKDREEKTSEVRATLHGLRV
jgi:hypothetical protein